ncbi:MAG: hypothetical protein K0R38_2013 [Polyangiaceae bacterium]|jgi:cysteine-rich repeat protein|nr:hypothetical protein [Polyangiaceae bacterium]
MKAPVLYGAIALCLIACSRPDSALFGPDAPESSAGDSGSGGTSPTTGGAETSGGSLAQGGTTAEPNGGTDAGGTSAGGTQPGGGNAGEPTEMPGDAGEGSGGSNTPPDPPMPVCGNGIIETGEQCDDAGQAGMDGCEKCQVNCMHFGAGAVKSDDHHCYRGYDEETFEGAVAACKERGAHLVTITSAAENEVVSDLVNSSKFIGGWEDLGLMEEGQGDYGWITGEALSYTNWAQGEPDQDNFSCSGWGNQRCYEHCLIMNGQGTWEDHRCDQPDGYACEWEPAGVVK